MNVSIVELHLELKTVMVMSSNLFEENHDMETQLTILVNQQMGVYQTLINASWTESIAKVVEIVLHMMSLPRQSDVQSKNIQRWLLPSSDQYWRTSLGRYIEIFFT